MAEENTQQSHISVPSSLEGNVTESPNQMVTISGEMVLLSWLAFIVVAFALHKLLWKPLLRVLERRETDIKDALDVADRARDEVAESYQKKQNIISDARKEAQEKIDQALREAASLKEKADSEARRLSLARMKEADVQIALEKAKAEDSVRTATIAQIGGLLERVLSQNLSPEQKSKYQDAMLREVNL